MNIRTLARRNVTGNAQRYAAYFLSCVFAVTVFFIYAQFVFHPDVQSGYIPSGDTVRGGMIAAQVIIVMFSVFFIAYSNSVFLQVRSKEFGLLSLFGMNNRQLRALVYYEQTLISLIAIVCGLLLGTLFSKLFLMLMTSLLTVESPITFQVLPLPYVISGLGFFALFQFLTLFSFWRMRNKQVVEMLKESQKPKTMPKVSPWLAVVALVFLAIGYAIALLGPPEFALFTMFPILFFVVIGTYFFFTQGTVAVYKRLYANKRRLTNGTKLLTRTNILFRLNDYARMLFITSIISAVVLTAAGTVYMFFQSVILQATEGMTQAVSWTEEDPEAFEVLTPETIETLLDAYDAEIDYKLDVTGIIADTQALGYSGELEASTTFLLPETVYNFYAEKRGIDSLSLAEDEAFISMPYLTENYFEQEGSEKDVQVGELTQSFTVLGQSRDGIVNPTQGAYSTLVIPDDAYERFDAIEGVDRNRVIGYELVNWQQEADVSEAIEAEANDELFYALNTRAPLYTMLTQTYSLVLFIGLFVSLLFFIVQGSMLYLKLFTELEDTKRQMFALNRIGITKKETVQILDNQVRFLFFVPVVMGSIHASFAYGMLSNLLGASLVSNAALVISIYVVLQLVYYLVTRYFYVRAVLS
ncbi:FtsX-like permease family protein [Shouchella shacheensis]|uniref:FtsX-like permease family protein n=1 Tax=Shouchella shacheensis TaxID=1649580 RepID=UPI00073FEA7D|nr:ABC transporter permease [Shouchella shacheensis]